MNKKTSMMLALSPYYVRIAWGAALGFCGIGILMKKPAATYAVIFVLAGWCAMQVIAEAFGALSVIHQVKVLERLVEAEKKEKPEDDDHK